jgi:DDE superfamily endonuclease
MNFSALERMAQDGDMSADALRYLLSCKGECKWLDFKEGYISITKKSSAALPPYSPDLNPIEQLFAKLKALLRKAAARTKHELWQAIRRLLAAVPPSECANYLNHCGYGST